jgi:hypothetical protein
MILLKDGHTVVQIEANLLGSDLVNRTYLCDVGFLPALAKIGQQLDICRDVVDVVASLDVVVAQWD